MRHQEIVLALATNKVALPGVSPPPQPSRTRRHPSKKHYRPTPTKYPVQQRSKPVEYQLPRRRRPRRQASWRKSIILAPTLIVSLLILKWLTSFLPDSFPAFTFGRWEDSPPQVAVSPPQISPLDALSRAIISQESTDNFQSLNPHSQALGLAQVMPANLSDWSKEALGYRLTVKEFLNNPDLQKKIINYKLSEYWQDALADTNGDEDLAVLRVASHWYSGRPHLYNSKAPQWYKGKDGKLHSYPSIAEYSNSVLERYRQLMTSNL